jgi:hypothetical protein
MRIIIAAFELSLAHQRQTVEFDSPSMAARGVPKFPQRLFDRCHHVRFSHVFGAKIWQ